MARRHSLTMGAGSGEGVRPRLMARRWSLATTSTELSGVDGDEINASRFRALRAHVQNIVERQNQREEQEREEAIKKSQQEYASSTIRLPTQRRRRSFFRTVPCPISSRHCVHLAESSGGWGEHLINDFSLQSSAVHPVDANDRGLLVRCGSSSSNVASRMTSSPSETNLHVSSLAPLRSPPLQTSSALSPSILRASSGTGTKVSRWAVLRTSVGMRTRFRAAEAVRRAAGISSSAQGVGIQVRNGGGSMQIAATVADGRRAMSARSMMQPSKCRHIEGSKPCTHCLLFV
jgi:hypothetical protein